MSIAPVPISIRLVLAPIAASSGNGEASWRAKWCTRKYAPSAPTSSAAPASPHHRPTPAAAAPAAGGGGGGRAGEVVPPEVRAVGADLLRRNGELDRLLQRVRGRPHCGVRRRRPVP